ncbi:MAG: general secretion pathway protein GspC [Polyangiaceae bacterium]|jgi:general secretion pathway protein C|nr:general secretion pathway protein GspC [Polyangiaceae bacterium]MBK8942747.1 general secretion pathway protein GspC [Polyangiaceae bacterium]
MSLDGVTRRYSLAIFGGLVAIAAYFQASGVGALVSGHLVPEEAVTAAPAKAGAAALDTKAKSGREILARNPFDSVTGPLDGSLLPSDDDEGPKSRPAAALPGSDPYKDPPCSGVSSNLITATEDKAWSFASIASSGEDKLRRIGDKVGSFTVQHIGYYESVEHDVLPRVWLVDGSVRCIVEMGAAPPPSARTSGTGVETTGRAKTPTKRQKLEADIKSKITKIGENEFEVDKSGVELIIQHYAKLAGSLRGKATKDGMKLTGIKETSILGELGMRNGDMLQTINGFDMSDPDKAVDAYAQLRRAGKLNLAFSRDGAPQTVNVKIK